MIYFNNYISYKSLPPFYFPNLSTMDTDNENKMAGKGQITGKYGKKVS
jgi:hypothetical protein